MIFLDTDHFSIVMDARDAKHARLVQRLFETDVTIAIPIIAVEEQLRAWLAQINRVKSVHGQVEPYDRLLRLIASLTEWEIVRWSDAAANEFTRLRKHKVRIGTQDLKIAALTLASDAVLLSANLRDFELVPGLRVEDWLYN
jgi:tRNA(fMet)-specific endonuclease VapC